MKTTTPSGSNKNPLYIEYYSHSNCRCYKIDLPWSNYRKHTLVLCEASKGIEHARELAKRELAKHLREALVEPLAKPIDIQDVSSCLTFP